MADVEQESAAREPEVNSGAATGAKGVSRRDILIGAGLGVSGLLVAGDLPGAGESVDPVELGVQLHRLGAPGW